MLRRSKYANGIIGLNLSIPMDLHRAIDEKIPAGLPVSEWATEILARELGVKIKRISGNSTRRES